MSPYKLRKPPASTHQWVTDATLGPWIQDRIHTSGLQQIPKQFFSRLKYAFQSIFFSEKHFLFLFQINLPYCWLSDENKLYASLPQQFMLRKKPFQLFSIWWWRWKPHKTIHNRWLQVNDVWTTHRNELNDLRRTKKESNAYKTMFGFVGFIVVCMCTNACVLWLNLIVSSIVRMYWLVVVKTTGEKKRETKRESVMMSWNSFHSVLHVLVYHTTHRTYCPFDTICFIVVCVLIRESSRSQYKISTGENACTQTHAQSYDDECAKESTHWIYCLLARSPRVFLVAHVGI